LSSVDPCCRVSTLDISHCRVSTLDNSHFPPIEIFNPRVVDTCRVSTRVNGVNSHTDGGADIIGSAVSAPLRYGAESARAGAAATSWRRATPSLLCGGGGPCCGYTPAPVALRRPWRCGGCFCSLLAGDQPPPARGACCWRPICLCPFCLASWISAPSWTCRRSRRPTGGPRRRSFSLIL
jgi:hypothetical protein